MEEDKKSTAVQPEEAPKQAPAPQGSQPPVCRRHAPCADGQRRAARRRRADLEKACRVPQKAAGQKKHKDNKNNKNRKAQDAEGC